MKRLGAIAITASILALAGCDEATVFNNLTITLADQTNIVFDLATANMTERPKRVEGNPEATRLSERAARDVSSLTKPMREPSTGLELTLQSYSVSSSDEWTKGIGQWNYGRTLYTLTNTSDKPIQIARVTLLNGSVPMPNPKIAENTNGKVLIGKLPNGMSVWGAIEHPMARYEIIPGGAPGERIISAKSTYSDKDLTNLSETRGAFSVPIKVTEIPMSITMTYKTGDHPTELYGVIAQDPTTNAIIDADIHDGSTGDTASKANTYTLSNLTVGQTVILKVAAGTANKGSSNGDITLKGATSVDKLSLATPPTPASLKGWVPVVDTLSPGASITFSYTVGFFEDEAFFRSVFNDYLNAERPHAHREQCDCFFCKTTPNKIAE